MSFDLWIIGNDIAINSWSSTTDHLATVIYPQLSSKLQFILRSIHFHLTTDLESGWVRLNIRRSALLQWISVFLSNFGFFWRHQFFAAWFGFTCFHIQSDGGQKKRQPFQVPIAKPSMLERFSKLCTLLRLGQSRHFCWSQFFSNYPDKKLN